jgi:hypothetical protein
MTRDRSFPVLAGLPPAESNVVALRSTHAQDMDPREAAAGDAQPRDTSWRDLVRRLTKNPPKR